MFTSAEAMYNLRKELLLLGDFNMDLYNIAEGRAPNSHLVDFCERFRLVNNIPEPTRVTSTTKRLIDVALTSNLERFSTSGTLQLGLSDHDLVYVVWRNKLPRPKPRFIEYPFLNVLTKKFFGWSQRGYAIKDSIRKSLLSNAKVSRIFAHMQLLHQRTQGNSGGK